MFIRLRQLYDSRVPIGVKDFVRVLLKSMPPGACLSLVLFAHACNHDAIQNSYRNASPDVDLSSIRIERRSLSENEPYIQMYYPRKPDYSFIEGAGEETWKHLILNGVAIPDYEAALKALGDYYCWVQGTRTLEPYRAFIDRTHNLELRFYEGYLGDVDRVRLMRVDNRGTLAFLTHRDPKLYDDAYTDYGHIYGSRLFSDLEPDGFLHKITAIIRDDRFLFYISEYIYIPIYGAFWVFPLLWAIHKDTSKNINQNKPMEQTPLI